MGGKSSKSAKSEPGPAKKPASKAKGKKGSKSSGRGSGRQTPVSTGRQTPVSTGRQTPVGSDSRPSSRAESGRSPHPPFRNEVEVQFSPNAIGTASSSARENASAGRLDDSSRVWESEERPAEGYCVQFLPSMMKENIAEDPSVASRSMPGSPAVSEKSLMRSVENKSTKSLKSEGTYRTNDGSYVSADSNLMYISTASTTSSVTGNSNKDLNSEASTKGSEKKSSKRRGLSTSNRKLKEDKKSKSTSRSNSTRTMNKKDKTKSKMKGRANSAPSLRGKQSDNSSTNAQSEESFRKKFGRRRDSGSNLSDKSVNRRRGRNDSTKTLSDDVDAVSKIGASSWNDVPDSQDVQASMWQGQALRVTPAT